MPPGMMGQHGMPMGRGAPMDGMHMPPGGMPPYGAPRMMPAPAVAEAAGGTGPSHQAEQERVDGANAGRPSSAGPMQPRVLDRMEPPVMEKRLQVVDAVTKDLLYAFDQRLAGDLPMDAVALQRRLTRGLRVTAIPRGRVLRPGFLRDYVQDFSNVGALETEEFSFEERESRSKDPKRRDGLSALIIRGVNTKVVAYLCRELKVYEHREAMTRRAKESAMER